MMMLTEEKIQDSLSKSEAHVYQYLKAACGQKNGSIKKSMKDIGDKLGLSEATVHRAIRKLRKAGVIGVIPSMEKAESNEIIYYGIPDPDKQVKDIMKLFGELSGNVNRFETILQAKDQEIDRHIRDKDLMYEKIDQLENEITELRKGRNVDTAGIDPSRIVETRPLDNGLTAYIVKND